MLIAHPGGWPEHYDLGGESSLNVSSEPSDMKFSHIASQVASPIATVTICAYPVSHKICLLPFRYSEIFPKATSKMRLWHAIVETAVAASTVLSIGASASTTTQDMLTSRPLASNASTSLTLPVTPIDPHFQIIRSERLSTPLAQNSLLMTAVNEMAKLASRNWNGRVGSFRSESIPGYSDVFISVRAATPSQQIDTKVVVWGLYAAIDSMRFAENFAASAYNLYWGISLVGILRFKSKAFSQSETGGQHNESESLDSMLPTLTSIVEPSRNHTEKSLNLANDAGMLKEDYFVADCHYLPDPQPLTFEEVLLPIITTLRDVAAVPKNSFLDGKFAVQPVGMDAKVLFGGRQYGPITSQNTYEYEWVISTLKAIPTFFMETNRFAEAYVNIVLNDVYVGVGGLDKRENLASAMVSTS